MSSNGFKDEWKTTANLITITRIVFIPVFVVALLAPWPQWFVNPSVDAIQSLDYMNFAVKPWVAAAVYAVLALTDGIDGYIARSRNQVTALGKFLDPIADKVLVAAALLALIELGDLPSWVALIIISREFIVSGLRMIAATDGVVVAARMSGKVKTALTLVAVLLFIIKRSTLVMSLPDNLYMAVFLFSWAVMIAALVMTVVSMLQYFKQVMLIAEEAEGDADVGDTGADDTGAGDTGAGDTGAGDAAAGADAEATAEATTGVAAEANLETLAQKVISAARDKGVRLATAESLTGGMVGSTLTSISGSSDVFDGGIISYAYDMKETALGVAHSDLMEFGAVSEPVAIQMAEGARKAVLSGVDEGHALAVAVTGVAGPGCSENKPAGLVWFGMAGCGPTVAEEKKFDGDRQDVRKQTVEHALEMALARIEQL